MAVWEGEQQRGALPPSLRGRYARGAHAQLGHLLLKDLRAYWRTPEYNATRLTISAGVALIFGTMYWKKAHRRRAALAGKVLRGEFFAKLVEAHSHVATHAVPILPTCCPVAKLAIDFAVSWVHVW